MTIGSSASGKEDKDGTFEGTLNKDGTGIKFDVCASDEWFHGIYTTKDIECIDDWLGLSKGVWHILNTWKLRVMPLLNREVRYRLYLDKDIDSNKTYIETNDIKLIIPTILEISERGRVPFKIEQRGTVSLAITDTVEIELTPEVMSLLNGIRPGEKYSDNTDIYQKLDRVNYQSTRGNGERSLPKGVFGLRLYHSQRIWSDGKNLYSGNPDNWIMEIIIDQPNTDDYFDKLIYFIDSSVDERFINEILSLNLPYSEYREGDINIFHIRSADHFNLDIF